jgi:hypothetical protein
MDPQRFDRLAKTLAAPETRRRIVRLLAALPLGVTLTTLLGDGPEAITAKPKDKPEKKQQSDDDHGNAHRRHGRKARPRIDPGQDKEHRKGKRKGNGKRRTQCVPESPTQTCAGKCATVENKCGKPVDCGPCACDDTTCGSCQTCDGSGQCTPDAAQRGLVCGAPDNVCKADGSCAPNAPPVALDNSFSGDEGTTCLQISLIGTDEDGHDLIFVVTSLPVNGVLFEFNFDSSGLGPVAQTATSTRLCYKPKQRFFHGTDSFTFKAYDGFAFSDLATIDIDIRDIN